MLLHNCIVSAYEEGFSGIYVTCKDSKAASEKFLEIFEQSYHQAMDDLEEETGCYIAEKDSELPCPASVQIINNTQFLIRFAPLYLSVNDGARADNDYLHLAVMYTLAQIQGKFPGAEYYGLIAYEWYDEHCGDVACYEISSEDDIPEDRTYPFIEEIFNEIFADEESTEEFWERFESNCYDITIEDAENIMACLKIYAAKHTKEIAQAQSIVDECVNED